MPNSLLIENGTVLTLGKASKVLVNHSVLIKDGLIARVTTYYNLKDWIAQVS